MSLCFVNSDSVSEENCEGGLGHSESEGCHTWSRPGARLYMETWHIVAVQGAD